jgi:hypothetical protein
MAGPAAALVPVENDPNRTSSDQHSRIGTLWNID